MNYNQTMKMGVFLQHVAGLLFLAVLSACSAGADLPDAQTATQMKIDSPESTEMVYRNWVVFDQEQAEEMKVANWLFEVDGFWTPSEEDILKLEGGLAGYLSQNSEQFYRQPPVWERLDAYQRQYFGIERDGKQVIYGNYFCDNLGMDWRQDLVTVLDGGECFFQVEYDVEGGKFIWLMVNGEA